MSSNNNLLKAFEGPVAEVYSVGDASQTQGFTEAVRDGFLAALGI